MARPGGNATGISVQSTELAGKRPEILREALPNLHRLAIIGDVGYAGSVLKISEVQAAARKFGVDIEVLEIRGAADIAPAFEAPYQAPSCVAAREKGSKGDGTNLGTRRVSAKSGHGHASHLG